MYRHMTSIRDGNLPSQTVPGGLTSLREISMNSLSDENKKVSQHTFVTDLEQINHLPAILRALAKEMLNDGDLILSGEAV